MSLDRFVYWKDRKPTKSEIRVLCEDFVGQAGTVSWSAECGRFIVDLPGECSDPCRRVLGRQLFSPGEKRWIEVFIHDDAIDIITRMQDPFTNALAERLAQEFAGFWGGRMGSV